ncbi:hepatitis A virus cellular receptor 1 homolog [Fundulus heteroclitus]|uniref:hepatitis A virus cellular receptor 1 homolog n=1 Tax=Fundulus heteroclitus TaxID=8078 RepID=UPI00165A7977|nr:hepatitis A virus cellular receptor 1 homolog [Fundulus heteroclitus]XP_035998592.1 hepatitis A virus cellular receptor 1 homolog [Fundulus heteroclitus]
MKVLLLLLLLTVSGCDNVSVVGQTGQDVTLRCRYDIKAKRASGVCWGRGELPNRGCSNQLIGTGDFKVREETRVSSRYQLLGRLDEGDVSLTIQNLREEDAGRYACRVGIPGLFNDEKHHVDLTVERGLPPSPPPETQTPTERPDSAGTTADLMTTENLLTSCTDSSTTAERQQEGSNLVVVLVCVLFLFVVLVTTGVLFIMGPADLAVIESTMTTCVYQRVPESHVGLSVQQLKTKTTTETRYC